MVRHADIAHFHRFGFVVLRRAFDPEPLSQEIDRSFREGSRAPFDVNVAGGQISGRYLPMMCERTPVSLALLDQFADVAAQLLATDVLPVRAKGVLYHGDTNWHTDSDHDVTSVGFVCYLEPLQAHNGALRVLPASHRERFGPSVHARSAAFATLPGLAIETEPGDVIVFDEHLCHSSNGGTNRRQWRVDFVANPTNAREEAAVRDYFERLYVPGWDGGYDADRYPTYGAHWHASGRPWLDRLEQLGAHGAAAAEEAALKS
ncbi:MAG: phytanoyl-CoA dioxygenase family protein [Acidimicrobiales bacterium]